MKLHFYPLHFRGLFAVLACCLPFLSFAQNSMAPPPSMRANLHIVAANGTTVLMDGNLTNYDSAYSNAVDMYDAWKMNNFSENFGILRSNKVLVIERRKNIGEYDTTFFKMWNMQYRNYRLQIITKDFNAAGLTAYILDKFLQKKTPIKINDTTFINFTVNTNTGSWNAERFQLHYEKPELPLKFISGTGVRVGRAIQLKWAVANEKNITKYFVEHSLDGIQFTGVGELTAQNLGSNEYSYLQKNPFATENFYRIKAVHTNGTVYYSAMIKVGGELIVANVFPNPIVDRTFFVHVDGITRESELQLVSISGIMYKISVSNINKSGSNLVKVSVPTQVQPGLYKLKIMLAGGATQTVNVRLL